MIYPATPPIVFKRISSTSKLPTLVNSWTVSTHRLSPMLKKSVLKNPRDLLAMEIKKPYGTKISIFPARLAKTANALDLPEKFQIVPIFIPYLCSPVPLRKKQKIDQKPYIQQKQDLSKCPEYPCFPYTQTTNLLSIFRSAQRTPFSQTFLSCPFCRILADRGQTLLRSVPLTD